MHRAALEGVVEILAMRRRAVDESGAGGGEAAGVAEGGDAAVLGGGERGGDVGLAPRGEAEAEDVEEEVLADAARRGRRRARGEGGDALREALGDGHALSPAPR